MNTCAILVKSSPEFFNPSFLLRICFACMISKDCDLCGISKGTRSYLTNNLITGN